METVGSFEAKTHFSQLLDRVEKGEIITITRHGRAVARLVPVNEAPARNVSEAIADLQALRKERAGRSLTTTEIKALIHEGGDL